MPKTDQHAALLYWRFTTAICAAHAAGFALPPDPEAPMLRQPAGHWGANPGLAWIAAHLTSVWDCPIPMLGVLGTGHATSFQFAHRLASEPQFNWFTTNCSIASVGQSNGIPTEDLASPVNPAHIFGEIGPAVGVSQALAHYSHQFVLCMIGDGECETPLTLAALIHCQLILSQRTDRWLVAINCNGHRMGGPAALTPSRIKRLLEAAGFTVFRSGTGLDEANNTAAAALAAAMACRPTAWLSVTEKGWPAPHRISNLPFTGAQAHKLREFASHPDALNEFRRFIKVFSEDVFDLSPDQFAEIGTLAGRLSFSVPEDHEPAFKKASVPNVSQRHVGGAASSMKAVDAILAAQRIEIFSPDEASSNGLAQCMAQGQVTEILAEELLFAWVIGCLAAGKKAAFVTYECFAPLVASQIAQYCKLIRAQPQIVRPSLLIVSTSLGWSNSPTHQNCDIVDILLNRGDEFCRLVCPVGASSASLRLEARLSADKTKIVALSCSKQVLPDLPDPGGVVVHYAPPEQLERKATIIACGDICVVEALAAAHLAFGHGLGIDVLAIVEPSALTDGFLKTALCHSEHVLASVWCHGRSLEGILFRAAGKLFEVRGISEATAPTPYEVLQRAGVDRFSLVAAFGVKLGEPDRNDRPTEGLSIPPFEINPGWRSCALGSVPN